MITTFTVYAKKEDMTFIMDRVETKRQIIERVIGWYYGKPDEKKTEMFSYHDLTHTFMKTDGTCGMPAMA